MFLSSCFFSPSLSLDKQYHSDNPSYLLTPCSTTLLVDNKQLTMSHLLLKKSRYISQFQMTRHLVTDPKYGFLKQLGINIENPGLYDGRWGGSGKVHKINPILSR